MSRPIKKTAKFVSIAALGVLALVGCTQQPPTATVEPSTSVTTQEVSQETSSPDAVTLKNLQAAYNGESNAHARYLAFAKKAETEGYQQVARLFQAAAQAEAIHAANHAAVIRKLGAKPEATIETPEVKSTRENLEEAINGESYERDTMYPEFIEQAKQKGNQEAVQTFTYAVQAETEHAKYYTQAKDNLEDWKDAKMVFYVCPECGFTTNNLNFENCPECGTAQNLFGEVV
ncbi:Rubrerythrin subfamily, putative [Coleofasciculus chthonoplastes PCC 7420]|uniref:Rubrerythrin subfamily, putative n=1 Tax=Coleofasciculus chthonoplastes PCC 7420 TaxID=118168 RepID=B4VLG9_9CYAN|nr:ferritin family protein [Coleofasciculus chthonoplastes]EDX77416.1 Rubrerythrin subfamily, putative [Coleofasciculus chthonoplastes PCC 7420]